MVYSLSELNIVSYPKLNKVRREQLRSYMMIPFSAVLDRAGGRCTLLLSPSYARPPPFAGRGVSTPVRRFALLPRLEVPSGR